MSNKHRNKNDFDEQFEAFLKESFSSEDSINSAHIDKFLQAPVKKESRPWWDEEDGKDNQKVSTSKSFLKKKASPISTTADQNRRVVAPSQRPEKMESYTAKRNHRLAKTASMTYLKSLREKVTDGLLKSSPNKVGMDTLDEMADKEKFFKELENNADGTIDYGRLNQELSCTANTLSHEGAARKAATLTALKDIEDDEDFQSPRPRNHLDPLSEREQSEQKPSLLSKVSLLDSLESTMNTTTSPQIGKGTLRDAQDMLKEDDEDNEHGEAHFTPSLSEPKTLKTGTGMIGTNTSQEIEALHKALERAGLSTTLCNDSQLDSCSQGDESTNDLVKKMLNSNTGKQRNIDDIIKELEVLQNKTGTEQGNARRDLKSARDFEMPQSFEAPAELRGFALSPAVPFDQECSQRGDNSQRYGADSERGEDSSHIGKDNSAKGGFDTSHTEDTEMYKPVTEVTVHKKSKEKKGHKVKSGRKKAEKDKDAEKSPKDRYIERTINKTRRKDSFVESKKLDSAPEAKKKDHTLRSRSSSPQKIETLKWKHKEIKSSGYGQTSPSKLTRSRSRDQKSDILGYDRAKQEHNTQRDAGHETEKGVESDYDQKQNSSQPQDRSLGKDGAADTTCRKNDKKFANKKNVWSPKQVTKQKIKGSQTVMQANQRSVATTHLDASIESFAKYIKDHFAGKAIPEAQYLREEPYVSASFKEKVDESTHIQDDRDEVIDKLKGALVCMEKNYQRQLETQKSEYEQKVVELKQENFVLNAKNSGNEDQEMKRKILAGESMEGVNKEKLENLKKDLKEQETLIAGYHQENKKLYEEMKKLRKQSKQIEEQMFLENQKLLVESSNLRTQSEKQQNQVNEKGLITGLAVQQKIMQGDTAGVIAHLETECADSKRMADALQREISMLQQSRVELEKHVDKLVMEREEFKKTIEEAKHMKSEEASALEHQYQQEIEKLKNKLKWYAENQELLDKGTKKLRSRDEEITKLKMRIEELQTETGKRVEDSKIRAKEQAADAKKIQDLQRQVKEMEAILKRRNPNSLPSLMIAAAITPELGQANNRTAYTEVLEQRVSKLEKELDEKDGETDQLLKGVEQKYQSLKLQFEERIKELEHQLSIYQGQADHVHPHTHSLALERELESVRERYKVQVKDLQLEVDRLTANLAKSKKLSEVTNKNEAQSAKEMETELRSLIKSLQLEIENKNHDVEVMHKSLDRLRKEKQLSFSSEPGMKQKAHGKSARGELWITNAVNNKSLPDQPSADKNEYQPKTFENVHHITETLQENKDLKKKVDKIQFQMEQNCVDYRKAIAESKALLRETKESYDERITQLQLSHQQEVKRLLAQQALDHSTPKIAELQGKVDTQEVMIKHLHEQQTRLMVEADAASVLRIKQTCLEETIKSLQNDLKEAKKSHTPEMRHFEVLRDKISQIENKHALREQELQQIIMNSKQTASFEIEKEVNKWRKLVDSKNNEIEKFRLELDSILEVLRLLQKQGVIIPISTTAMSYQ